MQNKKNCSLCSVCNTRHEWSKEMWACADAFGRIGPIGMEVAQPSQNTSGSDVIAYGVEQCKCPERYSGLSCQVWWVFRYFGLSCQVWWVFRYSDLSCQVWWGFRYSDLSCPVWWIFRYSGLSCQVWWVFKYSGLSCQVWWVFRCSGPFLSGLMGF